MSFRPVDSCGRNAANRQISSIAFAKEIDEKIVAKTVGSAISGISHRSVDVNINQQGFDLHEGVNGTSSFGCRRSAEWASTCAYIDRIWS